MKTKGIKLRFGIRKEMRFRFKKIGIGLLTGLLLQLLAIMPAALASSPTPITYAYDNFNDLSGFTLNNDTLTNNPGQTGVDVGGHKVLRLTRSQGGQAGSAFQTQRVSLANQRSFSAYFTFQISDSDGWVYPPGADGLVFVIQTNANNVGGGGGDIGYGGITPSVGVEFDTYANYDHYDPDGNHVGIDINGSIESVNTASLADSLESGVWHAWIDYNGSTDQLEVRTSKDSDIRPVTPTLTQTIDLQNILNMNEVYVGFTSGTGGGWANHDIRSFYFNNDYSPIDLNEQTYIPAPSHVAITANPILSNSSSTVKAVVTNSDGSPAEGQTVTFTTSFGTITGTAVTDATGAATANLTSGASGVANVRATITGGAYGETSVTIDKAAPVTNSSLKPVWATNKSGLRYISGYTVTLTATDDLSGVKQTFYRINNSNWTVYSVPFTAYANPNLKIDFYSEDNAGNREVKP